jgi:P27 family predicted phage terminase small subunit
MRGRKPKPTLLKVLDGNPGKRPLNDREPQAPEGMPERPEWLDAEAQAEWGRVTAELEAMGLLSVVDRAALAAYCTAWSRWVEAEAMVKKFGTIVKSPEKGFPMKSPYLTIADQALETMRKLMVEFGLTPSSRSRIRVPPGGDEVDELDRFLEAS